MTRRKTLPYGYVTYTGKVPTDQQIDRYNAIQARINSFIDAGLPVSSGMLDDSHKLFVAISAAV